MNKEKAIEINNFFPGSILPDTTVGGCIDIFENIWPNPNQTIEEIEKECQNISSNINWSIASTIGSGSDQQFRINYDLNITEGARYLNNVVLKNIHNQMYFLLLSTTILYAKKHQVESIFYEDFNFLKYTYGNNYQNHYDGDTKTGRSISAICYLNSDYEGGEIEFVNFGIKIKPEPGMLLLFPSNYAYSHIAHPVTIGTKYAIVTWIHDRPL